MKEKGGEKSGLAVERVRETPRVDMRAMGGNGNGLTNPKTCLVRRKYASEDEKGSEING